MIRIFAADLPRPPGQIGLKGQYPLLRQEPTKYIVCCKLPTWCPLKATLQILYFEGVKKG